MKDQEEEGARDKKGGGGPRGDNPGSRVQVKVGAGSVPIGRRRHREAAAAPPPVLAHMIESPKDGGERGSRHELNIPNSDR